MKKLLFVAERIEDVIENNFFWLANIDVTSNRLWLGRHYGDWMQQHPGFNLNKLSPSTADLSSAKLKSQSTNAVRNFGGFGGSLIIVVVSLSESDVDFISNFCRRTFSYLTLSWAALQSFSSYLHFISSSLCSRVPARINVYFLSLENFSLQRLNS